MEVLGICIFSLYPVPKIPEMVNFLYFRSAKFFDVSFKDKSEDYVKQWALIPDNTDVLISRLSLFLL